MPRLSALEVAASQRAHRRALIAAELHRVAAAPARLPQVCPACGEAAPRKQETPSLPGPEVSTRRSVSTGSEGRYGQSAPHNRP